MAQLLGFPLGTKPYGSMSKGWLPSSQNVKVITTTIPARNKRRGAALPVVCSLVENGTKSIVVKEPEAVPTSFVKELARSDFPDGFHFGAASSAYQIEGAWNEDGREPSIWDTFTHEQPYKIADESNGDIATDSYHRYEEDIQSLKAMGVDAYRFSISWSRILPDGTAKKINQKGIDYYNNLIDKLLENGITPYVTLFHWDVPQNLETKYGGFRSREIVDDFVEFARICYLAFGYRVKHWITINEPWSLSCMGYCFGRHAPGRCTPALSPYPNTVGNSSTEPYIVAHNLILAHAAAARLYKDHFQALQGGKIGITLNSLWFKPLTECLEDKDAATRSLEFMFGWFMHPLSTGDYPFIMKLSVKDRLPRFRDYEKDMIKGSYDFIGLNYYSTVYATSIPYSGSVHPFAMYDSFSTQKGEKDGVPIGVRHGSWINVVPDGIKELLLYIKDRYNNPMIYITENGTMDTKNLKPSTETVIQDQHRIDYMSTHFGELRQAMREGANVNGYFLWSTNDNFEWHEGYTERFGVNYIDYDDNANRYPKESTNYYTRFLNS